MSDAMKELIEAAKGVIAALAELQADWDSAEGEIAFASDVFDGLGSRLDDLRKAIAAAERSSETPAVIGETGYYPGEELVGRGKQMTDHSKATPRPWALDKEPADTPIKSGFKEALRKADIPFVVIFSKEPPWILGQDVAAFPAYTPSEADANAALTIAAVNSHDAALELAHWFKRKWNALDRAEIYDRYDAKRLADAVLKEK